jgi:quercetin dioxygenase-like cupin family protein
MEHDLTGWDIHHGNETDWVPWGGDGAPARAKLLGTGDGYALVLVEAEAGYTGAPHQHTAAEVSFVLQGTVEHQGVTLRGGDGYIAAAGSSHTGFTAVTDATYVIAFSL